MGGYETGFQVVIQKVEKVLVKPGALKHVSFKSLNSMLSGIKGGQPKVVRYNLYPINISTAFQGASPLLSTI